MARLARRTRSPESDDEDEDNSRAATPLSTAPNDRKRARRSTQVNDDSDSSVDAPNPKTKAVQQKLPRSSQLLTRSSTVNDADHQPGAIVRVKLNNFVTYSHAEFFPGPSLNMVIGPNGTGKSTLVCAICLGLGWGTQILGRGKEIGEFVKHGATEAFIEIELKGRLKAGRTRNHVIRRRIKKDGNKSEWLLNGQPSSEKIVRTNSMDNFNIQIDNLCQFLPQDKVVEFAQMDPKEILRSTQQAAGDNDMMQRHAGLIDMRNIRKDKLSTQRADKEELENLTKRQEMQQAEVERLRDREKHKEKLNWLERAATIPEFFTAKRLAEEAKESQKQLARDLVELNRQSGPTLRMVTAKQAYHKSVEVLKKKRERDLKNAEEAAGRGHEAVSDGQTAIDDFTNHIETDKAQFQKRKPQVLKLQQERQRLTHAREQQAPVFDARVMNAEVADRQREVGELIEKNRESEDRINGLKQQQASRNQQIGTKEEEIRNFDTTAGKLEQRFQKISTETLRAWKWIEKNQHMFEKPIQGPPGLVCNVPDSAMVPAIESFLQKSDLCIITAQNRADYGLLQAKLVNEQKLTGISLRVCTDDNLNRLPKPYSNEQLAEFGLDSYAIDYLEGPPIVLAMLCNEKKLHLAAIARGHVSAEQHERLKESRISSYYSQQTIHRFIRRFDLGPEQHAMSSSSSGKLLGIWTDQPVDQGRKAALQREVGELKGELDEIKNGLQQCAEGIERSRATIATLKDEVKQIQKDKATKQEALAVWNSLPAKIADVEKKLKDQEAWRAGARGRRDEWTAQRENAQIERAEAAVRYAEMVNQVKEAMIKVIEAEVLSIEAESDFQVLSERNKAIKEMLQSKEKEESTAAETARTMMARVQQLLSQAKRIRAEALELEQSGQDGFLTLVKQMTAEKWTPDMHSAEVDTVKAQIELTAGGNADAVRQYEERGKKMEELRARVGNVEDEVKKTLEAIREVRAAWEPTLEALVAKISDAFGESFARIGCAGQVEVGKANSRLPEDCTEEAGGEQNGLDFANWTINISVKFRENEPLSLLDSHRQSGGERAVSTIFYLMALQSLSRAPFRVVDEINQGMDGRNERMVHGRMVDVATAPRQDGGSGGSQYFLITPKLLNGLRYKRGMTVLCIVSGEHVPAEGELVKEPEDGTHSDLPFAKYPRLDFGQFAKKAKEFGLSQNAARLRGGIGGVGRRADSGVGMVGA